MNRVGKTEAAKRLLPVIGMITDRIKRDAYMRKLSAMISIDERSLYEELQRVRCAGRNQRCSRCPLPGQGTGGSRCRDEAATTKGCMSGNLSELMEHRREAKMLYQQESGTSCCTWA